MSADQRARADGEIWSDVERVILAEMRDDHIPSLVAAVVDREGALWQHAYGQADTETARAATLQTTYVLSSISKLFVAVAVMQLVEAGELGFDVDVGKSLGFAVRHPRFRDTPITTRVLLTHAAALINPSATQVPSYYAMTLGNEPPAHVPWLREAFEDPESSALLWRQHEPGTAQRSSNLGVTLLAHLVEVVSGEDFAGYARRHIFEPLDMHSTSYRNADLEPAQFATHYVDRNTGLGGVTGRAFAPGLARSTLPDLVRFVRAILNDGALDGRRILRPESVDAMLKVSFPEAQMAFGAGLALIWRAFGPAQSWLGHTGGGSFATASLDLDRERGVGVIVLTNAGRKRSVMPGGVVYRRLHEAAIRKAP